jgi:dephospho-CoA kinase
MIRVAVVGEIGSGKSYVAKQFGYPIFNADNEVAKIYKKDKRSFKKLKKTLPKYIFSFPIKKSEIFKAIIKNSNNLKKIIKIIHPEVRKKMNIFIKKNIKKKAIILDVPLFLENKLNKKKDLIIFVDAKINEINKRIKNRPNFNLKLINRLKKFQLPLEIKKKKSQIIIKNNFKSYSIKKNVIIIKKNLILNA